QAEDGIRYATVTGVQTCALPISPTSGSSSRSNPMGWTGYSSQMWGLTASDGPANTTLMLNGSMHQFHTYWARGVSLFESNDDGTLAPTAAGGAVAFTPEIAIPALLAMRETYGSHLLSTYGFRDAFNPTFTATGVPVERGPVDPTLGWFDVDYLGIAIGRAH